MPEPYRPNLLRGWLLDQVPREMQSLVEIVAKHEGAREERPLELDCPENVRRGLELLARRSVEAPPVRDLILDLARVLSNESGGS